MDWKILELYTKCYWGGGTPERGHTIIHDGTRFVMAGKDGIYFTDNGEEFEQISTTSLNSGTSMVYNGEVYVTVHGTEIGTLSKEAVFVTNPKQPAKSASALSIRHSGNTLHLNLPDRGKAAIYSLNGSKVRSFDLSAGTHTLRLSSLPRGMYIVRANSGAWNRSARVLIK
ncbi:MAG: T9SS type A sorting domain-containing protein [Chitinispirillia bacterium]|nr:T9SS type A sorting domain-containing protein [Chitinispirillia bacterium]MCL2268478.1 T9SS type A sorting domain-containing protein [Chitinispirillia bacterium]